MAFPAPLKFIRWPKKQIRKSSLRERMYDSAFCALPAQHLADSKEIPNYPIWKPEPPFILKTRFEGELYRLWAGPMHHPKDGRRWNISLAREDETRWYGLELVLEEYYEDKDEALTRAHQIQRSLDDVLMEAIL